MLFLDFEKSLIEFLSETNEFELNKKPPLFCPMNSFGPHGQSEQIIIFWNKQTQSLQNLDLPITRLQSRLSPF